MSVNTTQNIVDANAGVSCAFDDMTCKFSAWGERLTDVEYIVEPFAQWGNLIVIFWTLALALSTKFVFSIPFVQFDKSTKAKREAIKSEKKDARIKARSARRKLKKAQRKIININRLKGGLKNLTAKLKEADAKAEKEEGETKEVTETVGETKETGAKEVELVVKSTTEQITTKLVDVNGKIETPIPVFSSFDYQIVTSDNKAMSILYAGFVVSVMYAASGSRIPTDYTDDVIQSLTDFLIFSSIGYVAMCVTVLITAKILLYKVNVRKEVLQGNLSVAVTVAGICIATAINLRASLMGNGSSDIAETMGVTVLFFVLGQISVIIFGFLFQVVTYYDDQEEALKGNVAAGIKWAGNLIALAIVASSPIEKSSELASFGVFFAMGGVFVIMFDQLVSRCIVPGNMNEEICKDQNWGYALIATAILLTMAVGVDALLVDLPCPGSDAWDKYEASFVTPNTDAGEG